MRIVVIANETRKEELLTNGVQESAEIIWKDQLSLSSEEKGDAVIDLLFQNDPSRIEELKKMTSGIVIINSVAHTLSETDRAFVRINAWPGFLKTSLLEAASLEKENKSKAESIFSVFNLQPEWLHDQPGFITPRVVSMIVNEAYTSLEEGVSTKEDIDTAMKLGTNYPYGPFEWGDRIGLAEVSALLTKLAITNPRYQPAGSLRRAAQAL